MLKWLWLSALVVVLDQLTKHAAEAWLTLHQPLPITSWFNLTLAYNYGAAFSFLATGGGWQRWFFLALALTISIVLVVWLARLKSHERLMALALALILGGAVGNMIDRALFGYVIDFIDMHHSALSGWPGFNSAGHWPVFNLADSAISIGAVLLLAEALFGKAERPSNQPAG